jgi:hypothetical protein
MPPDQITPEIHVALMRALRSSTKFLGIIPRAQAIEAQRAATVKQGAVHDGPAREAGDAQ